MALNAKAAAIISITVEELLYGFSLLMFAATAKILISDALKRRANYLMIVASAALFLLSTAHMAVVVSWTYEGFVLLDDPTSYFNTSANPYVTAKNAIYLLETMLADMILIYRCYVLWQNVWIVLPCSLTSITSIVLMAWVSTSIARAGEYWFYGTPERVAFAAYALMLITSVASTSLLSYKLWTTERFVARYRRNLLGPSIEIVLQCGALYSFTMIAIVLTAKLNYFAVYIAINIAGQIIPITFYAVILRVRIARRKRDDSIAMSTWRTRTLGEGVMPGTQNAAIEVHISELSEERRDFAERDKRSV